MPAPEWLCHLLDIDSKKLTKQENFLLECELYRQIMQEVWELCKVEYTEYFYLFQTNINQEEILMELYIIRFLINELTKNSAYTVDGIARYTQVSQEIIEYIMMGLNIGNLITLPRRLVEIHRFDQPDLYRKLLKK